MTPWGNRHFVNGHRLIEQRIGEKVRESCDVSSINYFKQSNRSLSFMPYPERLTNMFRKVINDGMAGFMTGGPS